MSKIRSRLELDNEMSAEFAWRKKELLSLKSMVSENSRIHLRDMQVRAAITLLYAHWEGFIKRIGSMYLEFVSRQKLRHNQLPSHFLALSISGIVRDVAESSKIQKCMDVVTFFRDKAAEQSSINWKAGIRTKSNLSSTLFKDIVLTLGLDYSVFETKENLIDEKLLANRNSIAHGQHSMVDWQEYLDLHEKMLAIMQDFYNQVGNAAQTGAYRL